MVIRVPEFPNAICIWDFDLQLMLPRAPRSHPLVSCTLVVQEHFSVHEKFQWFVPAS